MVPETLPVPVVLYAAKSTDDVRGSLGTQLEDCREAVERAGGRTIIGSFRDEARSAFKGNRGEGLLDAKAAAERAAEESGQAELWVQHSDRIARGDGLTADHLGEVFFTMRRRKVRLRSVQDDSNLEDALRAVLIGERNYEDSARKSMAVRSGKDRQLARGQRLGGPVPDGFRRTVAVEDERAIPRYVRDPERAAIIEEAFSLSESGYGDPGIARRLNGHGHRTKAGRPWTRRRVQDLLTNPIYAGRIVRHRGRDGEEVAAATNVDPLIDEDRFDAIIAKRAERDRSAEGRATAEGGRPTLRYALAKLATCARCGERMYASTSPYRRVDGTRARHYVCANVHTHTGVCDAPKVDAEAADASLLPHLSRFFLDFKAYAEQVREATGAERRALDARVEELAGRLRGKRKATTAAEARYDVALEHGDDDAAGVVEGQLGRLRRERAALESEEAEFLARRAQLAEDAAPTDGMLDYWRSVAEGIAGRLGDARDLADVNAELRVALSEVRIDTLADGSIRMGARYRQPRRLSFFTGIGKRPRELVTDSFGWTAEGMAEALPSETGRNSHS